MLDAVDFGRNVHGTEFGEYGLCRVRFGKSKKGSPPKQRGVLTVWSWTPDILDEWFTEIRPLFGADGNPAAWPSERGLRVGCQRLNSRFVAYRRELGLDDGVDFHSLRRSYVTHLIEDGWDPRFVQVLLSPPEGVHDVQHAPSAGRNLRGGGGYLRSSITRIPRTFDACTTGADARLVA
jgi:hypothetical protein